MIDIVGNPINEGSLIAYGVTSDESLRLGIVTGISMAAPLGEKYKNTEYNTNGAYGRFHHLLQITPLDSVKLHNKWHIYYKRCVVLDPTNVDIPNMERYYNLQSLLENWRENKNNIHYRDKE